MKTLDKTGGGVGELLLEVLDTENYHVENL